MRRVTLAGDGFFLFIVVPWLLIALATYLNLDVDHNGMLSKEEFSRYNGGSLTSVFIDRLFQEYRMYRSETGGMEMVPLSLHPVYDPLLIGCTLFRSPAGLQDIPRFCTDHAKQRDCAEFTVLLENPRYQQARASHC